MKCLNLKHQNTGSNTNNYFTICYQNIISNAFEFLEILNVSEHQLKKIEDILPKEISFQWHTSLKVLNISKNYLENLYDNSFVNLINLEVLNLSENRIMSIGVAAFNGLDKLVSLDLSRNEIKFISSETFKNLTLLETLNLEFNICLMKLNLHIFKFNPKLKNLYINCNIIDKKKNKAKLILNNCNSQSKDNFTACHLNLYESFANEQDILEMVQIKNYSKIIEMYLSLKV